ncbi:Zn-dependent hydrolase [Paenibacillus aestuarii]|uniref:Zn-dependent hydrolase n=1 Tax=Paenibacillus aestuarii TaxID=516965 RepID=A0ABW0KH64_9BACL|nr:Zn-dependent hydrolase [Paenibacillus aestuarii]
MQQHNLLINGKRLQETIETFADFGRTANNGVTRLSLTEMDVQVRNYFKACCEELGLVVTVDDMGCMYATLEGLEKKPAIVIGSHLDTVRKGGRFDGVLGVIAGLEVVRTLIDHQITPKIPITIVNFTNEEGARFEPSMMASGVLSGKFDKAAMLSKRDSAGITFEEALKTSGFNGDANNRIAEATAYLELHIEQGPIMEKENKSIGVVDCVVGMICYEIEVTGESNHAGTTPMDFRKDAFFTANDLVIDLRHKLDALGHKDLVYTMGRFNVLPNIHTVIPNKAIFTIEARHKDGEIIQDVERLIQGLDRSIRGCDVQICKLWDRDTVWFDASICDRIEQAAQSLNYSNLRMVSGAGHDAQFVASFLPSAMIFVPSVQGKSHCEEEFTPYEDCEKGVNVLLTTVLSLLE